MSLATQFSCDWIWPQRHWLGWREGNSDPVTLLAVTTGTGDFVCQFPLHHRERSRNSRVSSRECSPLSWQQAPLAGLGSPAEYVREHTTSALLTYFHVLVREGTRDIFILCKMSWSPLLCALLKIGKILPPLEDYLYDLSVN